MKHTAYNVQCSFLGENNFFRRSARWLRARGSRCPNCGDPVFKKAKKDVVSTRHHSIKEVAVPCARRKWFGRSQPIYAGEES